MRKKYFITTVLMVLSILCMTSAAFVSEDFSIKGTHRIDGNETLKSINITFVLTAKNNAPMPEGSDGSVKTISVPANDSFDFGNIKFEEPGVYEYTVSRQTETSDHLAQDESVYDVNVAVFNDGTIASVYQKQGDDAKADKIQYVDEYYYILTYILNGGNINGNEGPIKDKFKAGTTTNLREAPVKEGYTFLYWKGSQYDAGAEYTVTEDHTFEAVYKEKAATDTDDDDKDVKDTDKKKVKTGDANTIYVFGGVFAVAIMAFIILKRKDERS